MPMIPFHESVGSRALDEMQRVLVGADGIEIRIDEYHARPLRVDWKQLDSLRRELQRPATAHDAPARRARRST